VEPAAPGRLQADIGHYRVLIAIDSSLSVVPASRRDGKTHLGGACSLPLEGHGA